MISNREEGQLAFAVVFINHKWLTISDKELVIRIVLKTPPVLTLPMRSLVSMYGLLLSQFNRHLENNV